MKIKISLSIDLQSVNQVLLRITSTIRGTGFAYSPRSCYGAVCAYVKARPNLSDDLVIALFGSEDAVAHAVLLDLGTRKTLVDTYGGEVVYVGPSRGLSGYNRQNPPIRYDLVAVLRLGDLRKTLART